MNLKLHDKRALVSGSNIGIGATIARVLAQEGVSVAIHGRGRDRAAEVASSIVERGGVAVVVTGDLTDDDAVRRLVEEAVSLLGGVDILVNNAGGSGDKHIWEEPR